MCHCFFRIATSEKRFILHMQYGKQFVYGLSLQFQLSWITLGAVFFTFVVSFTRLVQFRLRPSQGPDGPFSKSDTFVVGSFVL